MTNPMTTGYGASGEGTGGVSRRGRESKTGVGGGGESAPCDEVPGGWCCDEAAFFWPGVWLFFEAGFFVGEDAPDDCCDEEGWLAFGSSLGMRSAVAMR